MGISIVIIINTNNNLNVPMSSIRYCKKAYKKYGNKKVSYPLMYGSWKYRKYLADIYMELIKELGLDK